MKEAVIRGIVISNKTSWADMIITYFALELAQNGKVIIMTNQEIFEEACQYIPGGVNSPVRKSFKSVGEIPVLQKR